MANVFSSYIRISGVRDVAIKWCNFCTVSNKVPM